MKRVLFGLVALVFCGCAGVETPASMAIFTAEQARLAEEKAPDLFAHAQTAATEANAHTAAGETNEAADRATEARLWLAAAVVEAERLSLESKRLAVEQREREQRTALGEYRQARIDVGHAFARDRAASMAAEASREAYSLATQSARTRDAKRDREQVSRSKQMLISRARMDLAVASTLGAQQDKLDALETRLQGVERTKAPLDKVERIRAETEALLGEVRRTGPAAIAGLVEASVERGFVASVEESGTTIVVAEAYDANWVPSRDRVRRLAELLRAFPAGEVRCVVEFAGSPRRVRGPQQVQRRLAQIVDEPDRVFWQTEAQETDTRAVHCVLPAYHSAP